VDAHPSSAISFRALEQVEVTPLHQPDPELVKFNGFCTMMHDREK
jgi:hypothetical protein